MPWLITVFGASIQCDEGMIQELKDVQLHPNLVSYNAAAWLKLEGALQVWRAFDCKTSAIMPEFPDPRESETCRSLPSFSGLGLGRDRLRLQDQCSLMARMQDDFLIRVCVISALKAV